MKKIIVSLFFISLLFMSLSLDREAAAQTKILGNKEAAKIFANSISGELTVLAVQYTRKESKKPSLQVVTFIFSEGSANIILNESHPDKFKLHVYDACTVNFSSKRIDKGGVETVGSYLRFSCTPNTMYY